MNGLKHMAIVVGIAAMVGSCGGAKPTPPPTPTTDSCGGGCGKTGSCCSVANTGGKTKPAKPPKSGKGCGNGCSGKSTKSCGANSCGSSKPGEGMISTCGDGACGGSAKLGGDIKKPPAVPAVKGPAKPWEKLTHEERVTYMQDHVEPTMSKLFAEAGMVKAADFTCETCHGPNAYDNDYKMPNPSLHKVYPTGSKEQQAQSANHTQDLIFMFNTVVPTMRTLVGAAKYDPDTKKGFSCFKCHPNGAKK